VGGQASVDEAGACVKNGLIMSSLASERYGSLRIRRIRRSENLEAEEEGREKTLQ